MLERTIGHDWCDRLPGSSTDRHPGEGRGPVPCEMRDWIPAFAGMTESGCCGPDMISGHG